MAAAAVATLDVDEPQVAVRYPADLRYEWHHRVLLRRLRDANWVVATPDLDVQVADLAAMEIQALGRAAALPGPLVGRTYLFRGLTAAQLGDLHAAAARTAEVLGAVPIAAADLLPDRCSWHIADTAHDKFGDVVADDVLSSAASGVIRGAVGLARVNMAWVAVERVPDAEVDLWESDKRAGAGRDRRLAGDVKDARGRRFVPLHDALTTFRPIDLAKVKDWPHRGPRAVEEVLLSIRAQGRELSTFHEAWVGTSGIHADSAIAWEHRCILTALMMFVSYDQLDVTNCAGSEFLCRRLVMIERAVRVDPRCPCFTGLSKMIQHHLEEAGGVATQEFTKHIAEVAEAEAKVLKQTRLLREETRARDKGQPSGRKEDDDEDEGVPPRVPTRRRPKKPPP